MERLTRKLKKGGYSANRHSEAQLTERLDQLKGVHKQWLPNFFWQNCIFCPCGCLGIIYHTSI